MSKFYVKEKVKKKMVVDITASLYHKCYLLHVALDFGCTYLQIIILNNANNFVHVALIEDFGQISEHTQHKKPITSFRLSF